MNSFRLSGLKRKSVIFCPIEGFFKLHSRATEGKKDKKRVKKGDFLANRKSLNEFNTLSNKDDTFKVFDVDFTEGVFIAPEEVKTTVMYIQLDQKTRVFVLDKEGLLDFIYGLAGFEDIDLDNHPDFNKRFFLSGENKKAIQDRFTDELVLFFESNPITM